MLVLWNLDVQPVNQSGIQTTIPVINQAMKQEIDPFSLHYQQKTQ